MTQPATVTTPTTPTPNAKEVQASRRSSALAAAKAASSANKAAAEAKTETPAAPAPEATAEARVEEAAAVAAEKADPNAPKVETKEPEPEAASEDPVDVRVRVKQREMRLKAEWAAKEQALAQREAAIAQRDAQARQVMEREQRLAKLRSEDPSRWAEEVGLDEATHRQIVAKKIGSTSPEAKEELLRAEIERLKNWQTDQEKQRQEQARQAQIQRSHDEFVRHALSDSYPLTSKAFAGKGDALIDEGYLVQAAFKRHYGRDPSRDELAANIEAKLKHFQTVLTPAQQAAAVAEGTAPTAVATPAPAAKLPGPSAQNSTSGGEGGKPQSLKEKRKRAEMMGRKARESKAWLRK